MIFAQLLFLLIFAHSLADYPLQGTFLSGAKNRNTDVGKVFWPHALFAHSMIHGGFVLLITGSIWFASAEVIIHGFTDWMKCEQKITLTVDQMIHLMCKIAWAAGTVYFA